MTRAKPSSVVAATVAAASPLAAAASVSLPQTPSTSGPVSQDSSLHAPSETPRRFWLFVVLVVLLVTWWGLLTALVLTVSNPIVISTPQVVTADSVVVVRVLQWPSESTAGHVRVIRRINGDVNEGTELTLPDLLATAIARSPRQQTDWILPLLKTGNEYSVVRLKTQSPRSPSLVYPATPESIDNVLRVLAMAQGTAADDGGDTSARELLPDESSLGKPTKAE